MATPVETVAADGRPPVAADGRRKGVYWDKNWRRWYSTIQLAGRKKKYLGGFHSPADAAAAFERAVRERDEAKQRGQGE